MRFLTLFPLLSLCYACNGQDGNALSSGPEDCLLENRHLQVSSKKYDVVKINCRHSKVQLQQRYLSAKSDSARHAILEKAKQKMISHLLDSIIPFWYKTVWSFEGHS